MTTSWLGTVWSLRGEERLLIGQVRAIEGELVTLSVMGLGEVAPDGLEVLPQQREESGRLARLKATTLLGRWKRLGAGEPVAA
ncbi:MAG TPA: hypothetical protein PLL32_02635 [Anaeromyxobacteraceae bacterium]|nr:hypothetical protein [Anaeromyxobacteraceae bacterium]